MFYDSIFVVEKGGTLALGEYDNKEAFVFYDEIENQLFRVSKGLKNVSVFNLDNWKLKKSTRITQSDFSGMNIYPLGVDTIVGFQQCPLNGIYDIKLLASGKIKKVEYELTTQRGRIEQVADGYWGHSHIGNKYYFTCSRPGEFPEEMLHGKDRLPIAVVDSSFSRVTFMGEYPELYAHNNMGTVSHWFPRMCTPSNGKEVIVGFTASPDIYVYDPKTDKHRWVTAKSKYFDTIPLPFTEMGRDYFWESKSYYEYAQHPNYDSIIYDKWKHVYYRFVGLGLNDRTIEYKPFIYNDKNYTIMVLDESFNVLGEQFIGNVQDMYHFFVTPQGLFIRDKKSSEDMESYTLFKLS